MKMSKCLAASSVVLLCAILSSAAADPVSTEVVLKEWQAREDRVVTARVVLDKREFVPKDFYRQALGKKFFEPSDEPQPPTNITIHGECQLFIGANGLFRYEYNGEYWSVERRQLGQRTMVSAFDGKMFKRVHTKRIATDHPDAVIKNVDKYSSTELNDVALRPIWLILRGAQSAAQNFPLQLYRPTGHSVVINSRACSEFVMNNERQSASGKSLEPVWTEVLS